jgi:benzylsuccinate CoA-transferase BbsE subunit
MGMLSDVRVLEFSAPPTMLAARLLGDLGADVVTLEPPQGSAGRRCGPFTEASLGLESSLTWQALNYNKRGVTLDCSQPDGRAVLAELVGRFDLVIEASAPNVASPLDGLALSDKLIRTVVRPFSKTGPKAGYRWTDFIMMAASGAPVLAGEVDRPPLFFPVDQAMLEAGAETAVAALSALAARDRDGLGQTAEVSGRVAAMAGAMGRILSGFSGDTPLARTMGPRGQPGAPGVAVPSNFPCSDGVVNVSIFFGGLFGAMILNMVRWVIEEGELAPEHGKVEWAQYGRPSDPLPPREPLLALVDGMKRLCARLTMFDVVEAARTYGFMAAPVMTMRDISRFPHYRERGLFAEVPGDATQPAVEAPARFVQLDSDPIEIRRRAPHLSEHTLEILQTELSYSRAEVQALFAQGVI